MLKQVYKLMKEEKGTLHKQKKSKKIEFIIVPLKSMMIILNI
jgi:hypothetical protein